MRVGNMLSDYALCGQLLRDLYGLVGRASDSFRGLSILKEISVLHHPRPGHIFDQLVDGDFTQFMDGRYMEG